MPTNPVELGELAFATEDCDVELPGYLLLSIDRANAILAAKLERAPLIGHRCRAKYICKHETGAGMWSKPKRNSSHLGRLVCIEKVNAAG